MASVSFPSIQDKYRKCIGSYRQKQVTQFFEILEFDRAGEVLGCKNYPKMQGYDEEAILRLTPIFRPAGRVQSNVDFWIPWRNFLNKKPPAKDSKQFKNAKEPTAENILASLKLLVDKSILFHGQCLVFATTNRTREAPQTRICGVTVPVNNIIFVARCGVSREKTRWITEISHTCGNSLCILHCEGEFQPYNAWRNMCQKTGVYASVEECPHQPKCVWPRDGIWQQGKAMKSQAAAAAAAAAAAVTRKPVWTPRIT